MTNKAIKGLLIKLSPYNLNELRIERCQVAENFISSI